MTATPATMSAAMDAEDERGQDDSNAEGQDRVPHPDAEEITHQDDHDSERDMRAGKAVVQTADGSQEIDEA